MHQKKSTVSKSRSTNCESCVNYVYDEEYGYYICEANLDEDDMMRFLTSQTFSCPYYQLDDEYRVYVIRCKLLKEKIIIKGESQNERVRKEL